MLSIYAKEKPFILEDAVNILRNDEDQDATKCCNARTRSARRRRVMKDPGRGSGESKRTVKMVNRNK